MARKVPLAGPRVSLFVGSVLATLIFAFIATVVPMSEAGASRSFDPYIGYAILFGAVAWLMGALATSRIQADGGTLELLSLLVVTRIPADLIDEVAGSNGVIVSTPKGDYGTIAYGASVLQIFASSKSFMRASRRINAWKIGATAEGMVIPKEDLCIRRAVRMSWVCTLPLFMAAAVAYAALVREMAPFLGPYLGVPN
ncbi:hypothetical protein [Cellulomonas sp. PhB143]|uniref:hypothetical protein n=1 Tax=Cellulomonas sp. PhB143 TaxID=2485186 RepID=UPI0011CE54BB|nr:hypothetical protein [Cellulomonas sp. PhB143]